MVAQVNNRCRCVHMHKGSEEETGGGGGFFT